MSVKFSATGSYKFELFGRKYNVVERTSSVKLNERGKTVKWENPLVSDLEVASDLAQWLAEYYASGVEYEYSTRGNPELDATDVIYQENEFVENMTVLMAQGGKAKASAVAPETMSLESAKKMDKQNEER